MPAKKTPVGKPRGRNGGRKALFPGLPCTCRNLLMPDEDWEYLGTLNPNRSAAIRAVIEAHRAAASAQ